MDKKWELEWIYSKLVSKPTEYLLGNVLNERGIDGYPVKNYGSNEVHEWGKEDGCEVIYGKVMDLIEARIHNAVNAGILDRGMANEILKVRYYKKEVEQRVVSVDLRGW